MIDQVVRPLLKSLHLVYFPFVEDFIMITLSIIYYYLPPFRHTNIAAVTSSDQHILQITFMCHLRTSILVRKLSFGFIFLAGQSLLQISLKDLFKHLNSNSSSCVFHPRFYAQLIRGRKTFEKCSISHYDISISPSIHLLLLHYIKLMEFCS